MERNKKGKGTEKGKEQKRERNEKEKKRKGKETGREQKRERIRKGTGKGKK